MQENRQVLTSDPLGMLIPAMKHHKNTHTTHTQTEIPVRGRAGVACLISFNGSTLPRSHSAAMVTTLRVGGKVKCPPPQPKHSCSLWAPGCSMRCVCVPESLQQLRMTTPSVCSHPSAYFTSSPLLFAETLSSHLHPSRPLRTHQNCNTLAIQHSALKFRALISI